MQSYTIETENPNKIIKKTICKSPIPQYEALYLKQSIFPVHHPLGSFPENPDKSNSFDCGFSLDALYIIYYADFLFLLLFCYCFHINHWVYGCFFLCHGKIKICTFFYIIFCWFIDITNNSSCLNSLSHFRANIF